MSLLTMPLKSFTANSMIMHNEPLHYWIAVGTLTCQTSASRHDNFCCSPRGAMQNRLVDKKVQKHRLIQALIQQ